MQPNEDERDDDDTVEIEPPFSPKPPQPSAEDRGELGVQYELPFDFYEPCLEHGGAT